MPKHYIIDLDKTLFVVQGIQDALDVHASHLKDTAEFDAEFFSNNKIYSRHMSILNASKLALIFNAMSEIEDVQLTFLTSGRYTDNTIDYFSEALPDLTDEALGLLSSASLHSAYTETCNQDFSSNLELEKSYGFKLKGLRFLNLLIKNSLGLYPVNDQYVILDDSSAHLMSFKFDSMNTVYRQEILRIPGLEKIGGIEAVSKINVQCIHADTSLSLEKCQYLNDMSCSIESSKVSVYVGQKYDFNNTGSTAETWPTTLYRNVSVSNVSNQSDHK